MPDPMLPFRNEERPGRLSTPDPGSSTEEDEFYTPESPSRCSRFTFRRARSENNNSGRHGNPSLDQHLHAPAFTIPPINQNSFVQVASAETSFNRSFGTISSSQRTEPDTAATSFESNMNEPTVEYPRLRNSSPIMGSLDDQDWLSIDTRLLDSTQIEEHDDTMSSQFGSTISSDAMLETLRGVESEAAMAPPRVPEHQRLEAVQSNRSSSRLQRPMEPPSSEDSPFNNATRYMANQNSHSGHTESRSSNSQPAFDTPSKIPHYIRDIPKQHLFTEQLPNSCKKFPYFINFMCCRVAIEHGLTISQVMHGINTKTVADSSNFWGTICNNLKVTDVHRDSKKVWSAAKKNFENWTFKGKIEYDLAAKPGGAAFKLKLNPIARELSCRLQRKFGSDRFLYLHVQDFEKGLPSRIVKKDIENIEKHWALWFGCTHFFLGRKWRAFHIEQLQRKNSIGNTDKRIVLFATEGIGIDNPMEVGAMLNWFFPFKKIKDQSFSKAFSRVDLGLSRTIPTLAFKFSQIRRVKDTLADGSAEDERFNDQNSSIIWPTSYPARAVMNDGCAMISIGAARKIWTIYKEVTGCRDPIPSAFQGRIGGAKGMWYISSDPSDGDPNDIWIQVTESQLKFPFHDEDISETGDPIRTTFEFLKYTYKPIPSNLHISFIPILVDRGVHLQTIENIIVEHLNEEREELIQVLSSPIRLYTWLHQRGSFSYDTEDAQIYRSLPRKIKNMLESGFTPNAEPYLANCLYTSIRKHQIWMEAKLKVPLSKSTNVYGIADPCGVLAPGEVHMEFSSLFEDKLTGSRFRALEGDILVARQPACRRSDIQRVHAVYRKELSHLVDVVVFPAKGKFPLAGRLQGGDYDGDTFWLCWDENLVKPFKNAPFPVETPDPAKYGIWKDTRRLADIMDVQNLSTVDNLLQEAVKLRMSKSLLGQATNLAETVAYHENRIQSYRLEKLYDVHDLLVDAPKNGYVYTNADYNKFIKKDLKCISFTKPAYKQAKEDCENFKDRGRSDNNRVKTYRYNESNPLDYLFFCILRKHNVTTLARVGNAFPEKVSDDDDLKYPYIILRGTGSEAIKQELEILDGKLKDLERTYLDRCHSNNGREKNLSSEEWDEIYDECTRKYLSILPEQTGPPEINAWVFPYLRRDWSVWRKIRASAFYSKFPKRHNLVWAVAGPDLAMLKSGSILGSASIVPGIREFMVPRPPKVPKADDELSEDEDQFLSAEEDESWPPNITP